MLSYTKKLLSFLLVFIMLFSSTSVILPALAAETTVNFEPNGGTQSIIHDVNFENFDSYDTTADMMNANHWSDWKWPAQKAVITLNKDASHAYNGGKSMKICLNEANINAELVVQRFDYPQTGDGIAFWIESTNGATVKMKFDGNENYISQSRTVVAGKQIVTIPWSEVSGAVSGNYFWQTSILISVPNADDIVYIDEIGTYKEDVSTASTITYHISNGVWADDYTAPTKYASAGVLLPTYENITMDGFVFAGWYNNDDFSGAPVTVTPASGNLELYAKWVKHTVDFDSFNTYTTTEDMVVNWQDWRWPAQNSEIALNTDVANAYSGNSMKILLNEANKNDEIVKKFNYQKSGDGIAFWIKSSTSASVTIKFNGSSTCKSQVISVPSGKQFVTIPWSEIPGASDTDLWQTSFLVSVVSADAVVYIDDIGTYSNLVEYNVTFNTNGGSWADDYTAPEKCFANMVLPTKNNIENDGLTFAGWYDNESLTGSPVYAVPSDAAGDKTYWAKWIIHDVNFNNFDSYDTTADMMNANHWSDWKWPAQNSSTTLNSDSAHSLNGGQSMKVCLNEANKQTQLVVARKNMPQTGDGVALWMETTNGAVIKVGFNGSSTMCSQVITVPAGKGIVIIPWSDIPGALTSENLWQTSIYVSVPNADDIVYIDEIGTYKEDVRAVNTITYSVKDGIWADDYTAPTKYASAGVLLPTYENITMDGFVFAGWYDNDDFSGTPVTVTPATGNIVLYARWIEHSVDFDSFDSYATTEDMVVNWNDWHYPAEKSEIALNTDVANAYSGNSMKILLNEANKNDQIVRNFNYQKSGDGIAFWIKSSTSASVTIKFNENELTSQVISVPSGKQFVTIPWSEIPGASDTDLWRTIFLVSVVSADAVVYIDEIGTFKDEHTHAFENGACTGCDAFEYDYNADGKFDICDLIRIKKYLADNSVAIDESVDNDGTIEGADLVIIKKRLIGLE